MARFLDIHPENPQQRLIDQVVAQLRDDALIAYPTDSGYALGCALGNRNGRDRILRIRELALDRHEIGSQSRARKLAGGVAHAQQDRLALEIR